MAKSELLSPFILKWEGGFVCDPDDLGGATNKGITISTYTQYCKKKGYPVPTVESLKNISKSEWSEIFITMYWNRWKAYEIESQSVANMLVDWLWCSGSPAIKIPQGILGVQPDGIVGPKTLLALNSRSPLPLFGEIKEARIAYIDDICKRRPVNERFRKGWMNRINGLMFKERIY